MQSLSLPGIQVSISLLALSFIYLLIILVIRNKHTGINVPNPLRKTGIAMKLGFCFALCSVILAFSWTDYTERESRPPEVDIDDVVEIDIPRTKENKPVPPPPKFQNPTFVLDAPDIPIEVPEVPTLIDDDVEYEISLDDIPEPMPLPEFPEPAPLPSEPEAPKIWFKVEEMPRFPGCEHILSKEERRVCHQKKLLDFVYDNVRYPIIAKENDIQGQVVVRFVVDEKGNVGQAEVLRDIAGGCGKEVLRVVNLMNEMPEKWIPGRQQGRPVKVFFNLPIKFRLE